MLLSNPSTKKYWTTLATTAIAAALVGTPVVGFAGNIPATQPSVLTPAPQTPVPARDLNALIADFQANRKAIADVLGNQSALGDPAKRAALVPTAVPLLQKQIGIFDEMMKQPQIGAAQIAPMKLQTQATLYLLNDNATLASVDSMTHSGKKADVEEAMRIKLLSQWIGATGDVARQQKVADVVVKMDQSAPTDSKLTSLTYSLSQQTDDKATAEKLTSAATAMNTPMAKGLIARVEDAKKLAALEGKPLVVAGKTPRGKEFSSADWKGKVVLVDFWATWCGPCKAELPRVKKMYADYHNNGLEILSVSNDYDAKTLIDFTAKNGMPWPELYDDAAGSKNQWNPVTRGYGINGIPTMLLIDKKGICRTVEARSKMEDMIPALLAE